jgi:hypothetical protein
MIKVFDAELDPGSGINIPDPQHFNASTYSTRVSESQKNPNMAANRIFVGLFCPTGMRCTVLYPGKNRQERESFDTLLVVDSLSHPGPPA